MKQPVTFFGKTTYVARTALLCKSKLETAFVCNKL